MSSCGNFPNQSDLLEKVQIRAELDTLSVQVRNNNLPGNNVKYLNLISGLLKVVLFMATGMGHKKVKKCKHESAKT